MLCSEYKDSFYYKNKSFNGETDCLKYKNTQELHFKMRRFLTLHLYLQSYFSLTYRCVVNLKDY